MYNILVTKLGNKSSYQNATSANNNLDQLCTLYKLSAVIQVVITSPESNEVTLKTNPFPKFEILNFSNFNLCIHHIFIYDAKFSNKKETVVVTYQQVHGYLNWLFV